MTVIRVVTGLAVLALLAAIAAGRGLSRAETDVFRLLNDLPGWFDGPVRLVTQPGRIGAVPLRRWWPSSAGDIGWPST